MKISLALCALLAAVAAVVVWGFTGSRPFAVTTDKDDTYRVELLTARRWQRLLHGGAGELGFVRLYSNVDGGLVAQSELVDFEGGSNADVIWLMAETGQVLVGRDVAFFHVHPRTRSGALLPIEHEIGPENTARRVKAQ